MNAEEKVDKEFLHVLDKIKEIKLRTKEGEPLLYQIYSNGIGGEGPIPDNERLILENLEHKGAIKIIKQYGNNSSR